MTEPLRGLRELGTAYLGKESHESVADVTRSLVRLRGSELGFEGCLTSRPFTSRTFVENQPGAILPGRSDAAGADRVQCDLHDARKILEHFGFTWTSSQLPLRPVDLRPGRAVVIGPVRVDDRWCPIADRIVVGAAWRHLLVERVVDDSLVCFDVLLGGYTRLAPASIDLAGADIWVVEAPHQPLDPVEVAGRCLRAGTRWRAREADRDDRDGAGLMRCAKLASVLVSGRAARRLRLALQGQALQAWRWAVLLGAARVTDMDSLALADVLHDSVLACRTAHGAVISQDVAALAGQLSRLAALANATTELSGRLRWDDE